MKKTLYTTEEVTALLFLFESEYRKRLINSELTFDEISFLKLFLKDKLSITIGEDGTLYKIKLLQN
jgi:hypothetical protein